MRRFSCTVTLVLNLQDDIDETDVEEIVEKALRKLKPLELSVEDIEERPLDDDPEKDDDDEVWGGEDLDEEDEDD